MADSQVKILRDIDFIFIPERSQSFHQIKRNDIKINIKEVRLLEFENRHY